MNNLSSRLPGLPTELAEKVYGDVEDADIWNLRLTCRRLRENTFRRFRMRFAHRKTDLSTKSLQSLLAVTSNQDFSGAVKDLTILAVSYDTKDLETLLVTGRRPQQDFLVDCDCDEEDMIFAGWEYSELTKRRAEQTEPFENTHLLATIFSNLGRLEIIHLEAAVYKGSVNRLPAYNCSVWVQTWNRALNVYLTTMAAIAQARPIVGQLAVYGGPWSGSVPTYNIFKMMISDVAIGLGQAFRSLRTLSLCISAHMIEGRHENAVAAEQDCLGPALFLCSCPALEELDLHIYELRDSLHGAPDSEIMFSHISATVNLPKLVNCKLRGIVAREDALTRFLHHCPSLKILEMCNIALKQGAWRPVFDLCSSTLDHLTLQRLFEYRMILFPGTRQNEVYVVSGEELKRGIAYWEGRHGKPSYWMHRIRLDYGPPTLDSE